MDPKYIHKNKWILLFAFIYSATVFVFSPQAALLYDSALYADIGKNLITSQCFCSNFQVRPSTPPVFPVLISISMLLFSGLFIKVLLSAISFFGILVAYHFILKISNSRTAFLSSALFFLTPLVIYNSMLLLMDLLFGILTILSIWSYVRFLEKKDTKTLAMTAALVAIAIMTKMFGYVLILIFIAHYALDRKRHKMRFRHLAFLLVLIAVFLLPWNIWRYSLGLNEATVGELFLFGGYYGHISLNIESFYASGEPMNVNPISLDVNVPVQLVNIVRLLASILVYVTPAITLYFAYAFSKHKKHFKGKYDSLLLIWVFGFLLFFIFGFYYFGSRYLITAVLPMVYFFSRPLDANMDRNKLFAFSVLAIQLCSVIAITYVDSRLVWTKSQTEIFPQAGEWIKGNTEPGASISLLGAPESAIAYYGERRVVGINESADYAVVSDILASIGIDAYEKQTGQAFSSVKRFSDGEYYAEIYKRDMGGNG